jgi:hypothetical protein
MGIKMKSFNDYIELQEVGNQPYRWKRTASKERLWRAEFVTDNKEEYVFEALKVKYRAMFATRGRNEKGIGWQVLFHANWEDVNNMGVTGTQGTSAIRVFSTVANIFETFVKEVTPDMVSFTADKTERDGKSVRSKLYSRFAKVFAKKHGYDMKEVDKSDEMHFVFVKKEKK